MRVLLLALVLHCLPLSAAAQIYKWVDANGVTHYGEKPPDAGKAREVPITRDAPTAAKAPKDEAAELQKKDNEFKIRRMWQQEQQARADKAQEQDAARKKKQCDRQKSRLDAMKSETNANGDRIYRNSNDETLRKSTIARREAEYAKDCR